MNDQNACLYRFRMEGEKEIFYIGVTTDIGKRIKNHKQYLKLFDRMHIDIMPVPFDTRYQIESAMIRRYRPYGNYHVPRHENEFKDVKEIWMEYATVYPDATNRVGRVEYRS